MKVLTREHSLKMGRIISYLEDSEINANELTIQDPIIKPNGDIHVCVYSIDNFNYYNFCIDTHNEITLLERNEE